MVATEEEREARRVEQRDNALARANEVRLARAELKREVRDGRRTVAEVINTVPPETESMTLLELLCSQQRWGLARAKKLLRSCQCPVSESKTVGTLTKRQRRLLVGALRAKIRRDRRGRLRTLR